MPIRTPKGMPTNRIRWVRRDDGVYIQELVDVIVTEDNQSIVRAWVDVVLVEEEPDESNP
jgi:hypothetical protein